VQAKDQQLCSMNEAVIPLVSESGEQKSFELEARCVRGTAVVDRTNNRRQLPFQALSVFQT